MKTLLMFLSVAILSGCGDGSGGTYNAGYEAGYDGEIQKGKTGAYLEGYEDGEFEADCHWLRCVKPNQDKFKKLGCGSWSKGRC
jgi:hypothetical protein